MWDRTCLRQYFLQKNLIDKEYSLVDVYAANLNKKYKSIPDLAHDLTAPFSTDEEKVRSIFIWMANYIAYDYVLLDKKQRNLKKRVTFYHHISREELANKWEILYYKYATNVLRKRRGICEGYATLFYELCKASNIKCEMIAGYADSDEKEVAQRKQSNTFASNHAWNKVFVNNEWLYIDVTWASTGTYDGKRTNPTSYYPQYFLVAEKKLYANHVVNFKQTIRRNKLIGGHLV